MEFKGLTLDAFQEDAIAAIEKNESVVVSAPTGSGKTLIADYIISKDIEKGIKVVYTAPIKALSNQKFKEFSEAYGKENVGLLTGDIVKNSSASILIMTTEIYRNMAITQDPMLDAVSYVIFDEVHYINDRERGYVWEESIIFSLPHVRFLCLSATIPNAKEFARWIQAVNKHPVKVIKHHKRSVPLEKLFFDGELGICTAEEIRDVKDVPRYEFLQQRSKRRRQFVRSPDHVDLVQEIEGKTPCFFFCFSRKKCQDNATELMKSKVFDTNPEISKIVREKLDKVSPEIRSLSSTRLLRQTLPCGVGFHHAGLIPVLKELVEELFGKGLLQVLYTTETFAVGINMPAKTVCFQSLRKYDGVTFRPLNSKEYFQIAGRAGRRGLDKQGFVYAMMDRRDFDYKTVIKMTAADVEPIQSQFRLCVNTVLNLIKNHSQNEIDVVLSKNFYTYQKYKKSFSLARKGAVHHRFDKIKKELVKLDYVDNAGLTLKGEFSAKIYADEILTGEVFATEFYKQLNEFQMLMIIGCFCYEPREKTKFYETYFTKEVKDLKRMFNHDQSLSKDKKWNSMKSVSALLVPAYDGMTIFDLLHNTNLLEGDLIRVFRQMLDKITQIQAATGDRNLADKLGNCKQVVLDCLNGIDEV
jgi:superfamily II RNA helicase